MCVWGGGGGACVRACVRVVASVAFDLMMLKPFLLVSTKFGVGHRECKDECFFWC